MIPKLFSYINAADLEGKLLLGYPVLMAFILRGRGEVSELVVQTSIALQIIYSIFIFLILLLKLKSIKTNKILLIINKSPLKYFFLFIFISFFSSLWSLNPFLTIFRSFEMLLFSWLIISVLYSLLIKYNFGQIIEWIIFYAFWNLIFDIIGRFLLTGVSPFFIPFNPSRLFFPLFFFIILFFGKSLKLKVVSLAVILFGLSTKVFIGISLGLISFVYGNSKIKSLFILLSLGFIFSLFFIDFDELLLNTVFYGREKIGLEDSTGRDKVWEYLLSKAMERPMLGYGFASGEEVLLSKSSFNAINAHNTFLSALLGTGIIGLAIIVVFVVNTALKIFKSNFIIQNLKSVLIGTFILLFVILNSAPGIGGRVYGAWISSMFFLCLFSLITSNKIFITSSNLKN